MAEIRYQYYSSKYYINTYDNTIYTYEWIKNCFEYVFADVTNLNISIRIKFTSFNAQYECKSINEFKRYAFGKDIVVESLFISASDSSNLFTSLAYIYTGYSKGEKEQNFSIVSNDELVIANIKDALDVEKKQHSEQTTINKYEDKSVHIGDNAVIFNSDVVSNNKVSNVEENNKPTVESWYEKIAWNIIIPIIVGLIASIISVWLGLN